MNKKGKIIMYMLISLIILLFPITSTIEISANSKREIPIMKMDSTGNLSLDNEWMQNGTDSKNKPIDTILEEYRWLITGVSGIAALTMIAVFIKNFTKLAIVSDNPSERSNTMRALLWSGIAAIGLGSISLFVGLLYNLL